MSTRVVAFCVCLVLGVVAPQGHAKLSHLSFHDFFRGTPLVVVAKVTEVTDDTFMGKPIRVAIATPMRVIRGRAPKAIRFIASPLAMDDASTAVKGETALLFLGRTNEDLYSLTVFGRGYMPLRQIDGVLYASFWDDIDMPPGSPVIAGPDERYRFIKSVKLSYLEGLVRAEK